MWAYLKRRHWLNGKITVGLTMANVSLLKNGKVKAIKLSTLSKICEVLECQPGDILEYVEGEQE